MKTKHTKGEWVVRDEDENGIFVAVGDASAICKVFTENLSVKEGSALPNAKLIAAAPDLLEALAETQKLIDNVILRTPTGDLRERITDLNIKAIAAIKKATE